MKHSKENKKNKKGQGSRDAAYEEARETGGRNNASASRGGTTDMDDESLTVGRRNVTPRGSGVNTKRNVTGSDFDGQLSS